MRANYFRHSYLIVLFSLFFLISFENSIHIRMSHEVSYVLGNLLIPKLDKLLDQNYFPNVDHKEKFFSYNVVGIRVTGVPLSINMFEIDEVLGHSHEMIIIKCFGLRFHMKIHYKWLFINDNFNLEIASLCNYLVIKRDLFVNQKGQIDGKYIASLKLNEFDSVFNFWGGTPSAVFLFMFNGPFKFKVKVIKHINQILDEMKDKIVPPVLNDLLNTLLTDQQIKDDFYLDHFFTSVPTFNYDDDEYYFSMNASFHLKNQTKIPNYYEDKKFYNDYFDQNANYDIEFAYSETIFQEGLDILFSQNLLNIVFNFENELSSSNISCRISQSPRLNIYEDFIVNAPIECIISYKNLSNSLVQYFIFEADLILDIDIFFKNNSSFFFEINFKNVIIKK